DSVVTVRHAEFAWIRVFSMPNDALKALQSPRESQHSTGAHWVSQVEASPPVNFSPRATRKICARVCALRVPGSDTIIGSASFSISAAEWPFANRDGGSRPDIQAVREPQLPRMVGLLRGKRLRDAPRARVQRDPQCRGPYRCDAVVQVPGERKGSD